MDSSKKCYKVLVRMAFSILMLTIVYAGIGERATAADYKWKFFAFTGAMHPNTKYFQAFAKDVNKKTGGKLQITVHPAGQLPYKAFDVVQIVGERNVELGDAYAGFISGQVHVCDVFSLPFLVTSLEDVTKAYNSVKPEFDEIFKKHNSQILFIYSWPAQTIWSVKPIASLDDLKGLKMRGKSPGENALFKAFDAVPVTLETAELPSALERRVMDGLLSTAMNSIGTGIGSFLKCGYLIKVHYALDFILMNSKAFDELPPDIKRTLLETAMEYQKKMFAEVPVKLENAAQEKMKSEGTTLNQPQENDVKYGHKRLRQYWEEWAKMYGTEAENILQKVRTAVGK